MSTTPTLRLYGHPISQPTRAVRWALALHEVPYEFVQVELLKGANRKPAFLSGVSDLGTVPVLKDFASGADASLLEEDGSLTIRDSGAILQYLADKLAWSKWLPPAAPATVAQRAVVLEYLHIHHDYTRKATIKVFAPVVFGILLKKGVDPAAVVAGVKELAPALARLERCLARRAFIAGAEPSIADIHAYCELSQVAPAPGLGLVSFAAYPRVAAWLTAVSKLPHHDAVHRETHAFFRQLAPAVRPVAEKVMAAQAQAQ